MGRVRVLFWLGLGRDMQAVSAGNLPGSQENPISPLPKSFLPNGSIGRICPLHLRLALCLPPSVPDSGH